MIDPEIINEIRIDEQFTSLVTPQKAKDRNTDNIPMIRKHIKSTESFLNGIKKSFLKNDDILPLNCRYSKYLRDDSKFFIIEDGPHLRTINADLYMESTIEKLKLKGQLDEFGFTNFLKENKQPYKFILSFPYIVYLIKLSSSNYVQEFKIFFRLSPLTGRSDYLLKANLPNIDRYQKVCLGNKNKESSRNLTINETCEYVIHMFWSSIFNEDYNYNLIEYGNKVSEVGDYLTWMYYTKKDPMFIFDVTWISYKNTIGKEIYNMTNVCDEFSQLFNFKTLENSLIKIQKNEEIKNEEISYENLCESITFSNGILSVGDSFIFEDEEGVEVFINSFIGHKRSNLPTHIEVETTNQEILTIKLDLATRNSIDMQLMKRNYIESTKLKNKVIVKIGDIIKVNFPFKLYKMVERIRKARDGKIEIILNGDNYLAENLEAEIFDIFHPKYNEISLKPNETYILEDLCHVSSNTVVLVNTYEKVKFLKVNVNTKGELNFVFKNVTAKVIIHVPIGKTNDQKIHEMLNINLAPEIFRLGSQLFSNFNQTILMSETGYLADADNYLKNKITIEKVFNFCMSSSKESLKISSFDNEINFEIGDKVVVTDWKDPINMLMIHTIESFYYNKEKDAIEICLKDKDGKIKSVQYIKKEGIIIYVNIGAIRKIQTKYEGITSGTKIRAIKSGISNFPKKDVNIIIGFLTDTGAEPLVLCSNCCTIWYSDLIINFELIQRSSVKWGKFKHTPIIISKIKYQCGDIISGVDGFPQTILANVTFAQGLHLADIRDFSRNYFYTNKANLQQLKNYYIRHGFITPRYSISQISTFPKFSGVPNFHGSYTKKDLVKILFFQDKKEAKLNV